MVGIVVDGIVWYFIMFDELMCLGRCEVIILGVVVKLICVVMLFYYENVFFKVWVEVCNVIVYWGGCFGFL